MGKQIRKGRNGKGAVRKTIIINKKIIGSDQLLALKIGIEGNYKRRMALLKGSKWDMFKKQTCSCCSKFSKIWDLYRCDYCRLLVCKTEECSGLVGNYKHDPYTPKDLCKNRLDGINHPDNIFCGYGCGCFGENKENFLICTKCYNNGNHIDEIEIYRN